MSDMKEPQTAPARSDGIWDCGVYVLELARTYSYMKPHVNFGLDEAFSNESCAL